MVQIFAKASNLQLSEEVEGGEVLQPGRKTSGEGVSVGEGKEGEEDTSEDEEGE